MGKIILASFMFLVINCAEQEDTNNSETLNSGNPELDKRVNYSGYTSKDFDVVSLGNLSSDPDVIQSEITEKISQEFNQAFEIARSADMFVNKPIDEDILTRFKNLKISGNGTEVKFSAGGEADLEALVSAGGSLSVSGSVIPLDIKGDLYGKEGFLIAKEEPLGRVYISKDMKISGSGTVKTEFGDILSVVPQSVLPKATAVFSLISLLANGGKVSSKINIGLEQKGIFLVDSAIEIVKVPKRSTSINRLTEIFFENVVRRICRLQDEIHDHKNFNCNMPYDAAVELYIARSSENPSGRSLHLPDLLLPMIGCVETSGVMHYVFSRPAGVKGFNVKSDPKFFELKDNGLNSSSPERFTNFTHVVSSSTPILGMG